MDVFTTSEPRLLLALMLGLLIGVERERRRAERGYGAFAGVRTFSLVALLGGLLTYLDSTALVVAGALSITLLAVAAYVVNRSDEDRGITTEVALVVTYMLGVAALRTPGVAASAAVLVTAVLAFRSSLHKAVRDVLTEIELRDGLLFLIFALVLLPLSPDVQIGPYDAIHPRSLVRLVCVLMAVNGLGHLAQRWLGARYGLALTGFAGGFVSSSATIAAMSMRAKEAPERSLAAVAGAIASCVSTSVQYLIIVATINPGLLRVLAFALVAPLLTALVATLALSWAASRGTPSTDTPGRPFSLRAALLFVAVFCVVSIGAAGLHGWLGDAGIVLVSALAAFVDAHSTAGSLASLHGAAQLDDTTALWATLAALTTNNITKLALAWSGRNVRFGVCTSALISLTALSAWLSLWFE